MPWHLIVLFVIIGLFIGLLLYMIYYVVTGKHPKNHMDEFWLDNIEKEAAELLKVLDRFKGFGK